MGKNNLLSDTKKISVNDWPPEAKLCKALEDLGTILSKSLWWERYCEISSRMGAGCALSLKTATTLFEKDELTPIILEGIEKVIKSHEELNGTK